MSKEKYKRRIKHDLGSSATIPIKNKREVDAIVNYFLIERDKAKSEVKQWQADRNHMFCILGFNSAFRSEDLLQLKVKDVNKGYFHIVELKTGKLQNFRMNKAIFDEVLEYIERNNLSPNEYLFYSQKNKLFAMTRQNADLVLKKAAAAIKLKQPFSCHAMRKTFGYHYIKAGGNPITLMKMYNHDSTEVTLLYVMWGTDDAENDRSTIALGIKGKR